MLCGVKKFNLFEIQGKFEAERLGDKKLLQFRDSIVSIQRSIITQPPQPCVLDLSPSSTLAYSRAPAEFGRLLITVRLVVARSILRKCYQHRPTQKIRRKSMSTIYKQKLLKGNEKLLEGDYYFHIEDNQKEDAQSKA